MSLPPSYEISINSGSNIVITHPASDNEASQFLKSSLKSNEIVFVWEATTGGKDYISKKQQQWVVNNYSGIRTVVNEFSDQHDIRISKSVANLIN